MNFTSRLGRIWAGVMGVKIVENPNKPKKQEDKMYVPMTEETVVEPFKHEFVTPEERKIMNEEKQYQKELEESGTKDYETERLMDLINEKLDDKLAKIEKVVNDNAKALEAASDWTKPKGWKLLELRDKHLQYTKLKDEIEMYFGTGQPDALNTENITELMDSIKDQDILTLIATLKKADREHHEIAQLLVAKELAHDLINKFVPMWIDLQKKMDDAFDEMRLMGEQFYGTAPTVKVENESDLIKPPNKKYQGVTGFLSNKPLENQDLSEESDST